MSENNKKEYKYDAFISYRHTEPDKFVAEKIQKYLEEFKLPKNIKNKDKLRKTRIERVFRDKEELAITNNLEDPIIQALKDSEYLIVICSPRIKESVWCLKEIENFIEFHGRNKILTVLIEGEPEDSFPEILLFEEEHVWENSVETTRRREVEPLAADVRGKSKNQIWKLIKTELLRVIAPMFGLEYDDLRQRHKERRMKKILMATIFAAIFGIIIGVAGVSSALIINSQNEQIQEKNEKLLYNQADNLAKESLLYFEQDKRMDALKLAYSSVTEYEGDKMPHTPTGEYALTQALRIYDTGDIYKADKQLVSSANILDMKLSPSGNYVISFDTSLTANIWSLTTGKLMLKIEDVYSYNIIDFNVEFVGDSKVAYRSKSGKIKVVDFIKQQEVLAIDGAESALSVKGDVTGQNVAVVWNEKIEVYDTPNGNLIYQIEEKDGNSFGSNIGWYDDNLVYIVKEQDANIIKCVDINLKPLFEVPGDFNRIVDVKSSDEYIYVLAEYFDSMDDNIFATVIEVDKTGNIQWESMYPDIQFSSIDVVERNGERIIVTTSYSAVYGIDENLGEEKFVEYISEDVSDVAVDSDGFIQIISRDGSLYSYNVFLGELYIKDWLIEHNIDEISQIKICKDGFVFLPYASNCLIKYEKIDNKDKKIYDGDIDRLIRESMSDKNETIDIANSDLVAGLLYTEDKKVAFITYFDLSMEIYDVVNKKVINSVNQVKSAPSRFFGTDKDGKVYIGSDTSGYCFDKDYNMLWEIDNLLYVDVEKEYMIIGDIESVCWQMPIYSLEELINKAEKEIKN